MMSDENLLFGPGGNKGAIQRQMQIISTSRDIQNGSTKQTDIFFFSLKKMFLLGGFSSLLDFRLRASSTVFFVTACTIEKTNWVVSHSDW